MIELDIVKYKNGVFSLYDKKNDRHYDLFLEFYGIDYPKTGDKISLPSELLNPAFEGFCQPYAFEVVQNKNEYDKQKKTEFATLLTNDKKYLLRRIYG